MNPCTALIIDDESELSQVLEHKLRIFCPHIQVVGTATHIEEACDLIGSHHPQLIFLDISLAGETGFDLLRRLDRTDFEIIFLDQTATHALEAIKVSAVDFLLKPVVPNELVVAVQKAQRRIVERELLQQFHLQQELAYKIAIPASSHYECVNINDIIRCEGWEKYTRIYLQDGRCLLSSYRIGCFRELLEGQHFYSPHKSHIINTEQIVQYQRDGRIIMQDGAEVPVARRKREAFVEEVLRGMLVG